MQICSRIKRNWCSNGKSVKASEKTIKDGSYTLQRPFVMATKGKISEQSKEVQAVFDFINSEAGQKVIEQVGLIIPDKK